jgi:hypothetical protein
MTVEYEEISDGYVLHIPSGLELRKSGLPQWKSYEAWLAAGKEPRRRDDAEVVDISAAIYQAEHDEWLIEQAALRALGRMATPAPAPEPEPEPETHFADLMLADETIEDAKARLSQRLKELRHYLIAPEIRVNEDGSLGLTPAEQAELADLERRQTLGRWLEA